MNTTFENCTLLDTYSWFTKARPAVSLQDEQSQLGVHFEEITEMLDQLSGNAAAVEAIMSARRAMKTLADLTKAGKGDLRVLHHGLYLDSICDQIVTATGVAYTQGYDVVGAMNEVNRSNFSKFDEQGNPIRNEHGKIMKGPNYTVANLDPFTGKLQS